MHSHLRKCAFIPNSQDLLFLSFFKFFFKDIEGRKQ
jgi:hypothetical protein